MQMEYDVKINIQPDPGGRYFLYAEDRAGNEADPSYWAPSLLMWHEESFLWRLHTVHAFRKPQRDFGRQLYAFVPARKRRFQFDVAMGLG